MTWGLAAVCSFAAAAVAYFFGYREGYAESQRMSDRRHVLVQSAIDRALKSNSRGDGLDESEGDGDQSLTG